MKSRRYKLFLKSCSVKPSPAKPSKFEGKQWVKVNGNYKLVESEKLYRLRSERSRMAFCFSEKDLATHLAKMQKIIDEHVARIDKEKEENKILTEEIFGA